MRLIGLAMILSISLTLSLLVVESHPPSGWRARAST